MELAEIIAFLAARHPFDLLPREALEALVRKIEIRYVRKGTVIMSPGDVVTMLSVVRSGAVETHDGEGNLLARLGEGEVFGVRALFRGGRAVHRSAAIEDCLLYQIPAPAFERLRRDHAAFAFHFAPLEGGRLKEAQPLDGERSFPLLSMRIADLLRRPPVTVAPETPVREASQRMRDEGVSSLLVSEGGKLVGILTDRDLRNRVLAAGLDPQTAVAAVMTRDPHRIDADRPAFDASMAMSRHNIHHLPVVQGDTLIGCVTTTNLVNAQTVSTVHLAGEMFSRRSVEGLRDVVRQIPGLVFHLVQAGATARGIGLATSTLADAAARRLLQLGEEKLGPPPVPYVWLAAGSQARQEQSAVSDQDNALLLDEAYDEARHGDYFRELAQMVCSGLDTCGYVFCPGEAMAMTTRWRQPLGVWQGYFRRWIEEPDPKALMLSSIFFDLRPVHGSEALFETLRATILERARRSRIFQAYMAKNALTHHPPLGFFRNLVLIRGGEHHHALDLKHNGVVPIVDLARVHALTLGSPAVNTDERLHVARDAGLISADGAADLIEALEYIGHLRILHQARQVRAGKPADNFMQPKDLSGFERAHLKDAFAVVKTMQAALANTYQADKF